MTPSSRAILRRHGRDFVVRAVLLALLAGGLSAAAAPRHAGARAVEPPAPFQSGAADLVREARPLCIDPMAAAEGDRLLRRMTDSAAPGAWKRAILARDRDLMPFLIRSLLSDEEGVARAAADVLRTVCSRRELILSDGTNPADLRGFSSPRVRAEAYDRFAAWWRRNARHAASWD